jgi:hypothetical protein
MRHISTEDENCPGKLLVVTVPENVDAVHSTILTDQTISAKRIPETLEISRERVGFIIHNMMDMKKLSAKLVPKCLKEDQKLDCIVV